MLEHLKKDRPSPWLVAYRILSKWVVALPELYHETCGLAQMKRSFQATTVVAPIPGPLSAARRATLSSKVLYSAYLAARSGGSFLSYCRSHRVKPDGVRRWEGGSGHAAGKQTIAVGVRFHFELLDLYHGEWASLLLPHGPREALRNNAYNSHKQIHKYKQAIISKQTNTQRQTNKTKHTHTHTHKQSNTNNHKQANISKPRQTSKASQDKQKQQQTVSKQSKHLSLRRSIWRSPPSSTRGSLLESCTIS